VVLHPAWRRWTAKLVHARRHRHGAMEVLRFAVLKPVHLPSPAVLNLARIRSWVAAGEECEDGGGGRTGGSRAKMYWQHYNLEAREENVTCPKPPSKTA
jgi:hypothetical protein